jgi:hypothetical protein
VFSPGQRVILNKPHEAKPVKPSGCTLSRTADRR